MAKKIFYIIYNNDDMELPYAVCNNINEISKLLKVSARSLNGRTNGLEVFTYQNKEYTIVKYNENDLGEEL